MTCKRTILSEPTVAVLRVHDLWPRASMLVEDDDAPIGPASAAPASSAVTSVQASATMDVSSVAPATGSGESGDRSSARQALPSSATAARTMPKWNLRCSITSEKSATNWLGNSEQEPQDARAPGATEELQRTGVNRGLRSTVILAAVSPGGPAP